MLLLISSTTTILFCLARKYKGLRIKHAFFLHKFLQNINRQFFCLIIKITISSIVIGLKNSNFPLIQLPSCYRTVCYRTACYRTACYRTICYRTVQQTNKIQSCSLNQPITTLVSITIETVYKLLNLCILCQFFNVKFPFVT